MDGFNTLPVPIGEKPTRTGERQRPSEHGWVMGAALAGLASAMAPLHPEIPEMCRTCAFRAGTVPNRMAGTTCAALDCVAGIDPAPFGCHHTLGADGRPLALCSGYLLARLAPADALAEAMIGVLVELGKPPEPRLGAVDASASPPSGPPEAHTAEGRAGVLDRAPDQASHAINNLVQRGLC